MVLDIKACSVSSPSNTQCPDTEVASTDESTTKTSSVALEFFSRTGRLTDADYDWSKSVNPWYALWNCQRTSIATARMLELGARESASIVPIVQCAVSEVANQVFPHANKQRDFAYATCSLELLQKIMLRLGKGTHAVISARSNRHVGRMFNAGHLFNYVLNCDRDGTFRFVVLDSYGGAHTKLSLHSPKDFFALYDNDVEAVIFYNKEQGKILTLNASRSIDYCD